MMHEANGHVDVINNLPVAFTGEAQATVYNLDGTQAVQQTFPISTNASAATDAGAINWPATLTPVHFIEIKLNDGTGKLVSENFYWHSNVVDPKKIQDFTTLNELEPAALAVSATRHDENGKLLLEVTVKNPTNHIALMAHLQLRRKTSGERVLPVYYSDNYISMAPGETKTISIEASSDDLKGDVPCLALDGWNVSTTDTGNAEVAIENNADALVTSVPAHDFVIVPGKKY